MVGTTEMKLLRGRAVVAHKAHNLEVAGSTPAPATSFRHVGEDFRSILPLPGKA